MEWLSVLLLCLVGHGEGGALKCARGNQDSACIESEKETPIQLAQERISQSVLTECLSGTEWESNCHSCKCSGGQAVCQRLLSCDEEYAEPIRCKPTTSFARDCNTCTCMDNGMILCTLVYCEKIPVQKPSEGKECAPGSHWKSQCNDCGCIQDGYSFCTEKACLLDNEPPKRCAPDTRWVYDCNTCWCSPTGVPICTKRSCLRDSEEFKDEDKLEEKTADSNLITRIRMNRNNIKAEYFNRENDDSRHSSEMNIEIEVHDPTFADSNNFEQRNIKEHAFNNIESDQDTNERIESHYESVQSKDEHNVLKRSVCKPYQEFQSECNQCKCAADGQSYTCTQNECMDDEKNREVEVFMENEGVDHIERHSVCKPRGVFYIGCNTCHCNPYGTDYSCTNKPCPLPEDVELFHELKEPKSSTNSSQKIVCAANKMFIKDCNTCWCNEDGTSFICTRKVCVPELPDDEDTGEEKPEDLRVIQRTCRPNEVFELDCNMCRCNPEGTSFSCTRRACLDSMEDDLKNTTLTRRIREVSKSELPKNCLPNQEFRMDCNKCLCDPAGIDFSCTRIDCYQLNNNNNNNNGNNHAEVRTRRDAEHPGSGCVPGTSWTEDCDTCRCSLDGHVAMCVAGRCGKRHKRESSSNEINSETQPSFNPEGTSLDTRDEISSSTSLSTESDPNFRCNPGEQFKRGCNDCSCLADGKSFYCTLRRCDQDITPLTSF